MAHIEYAFGGKWTDVDATIWDDLPRRRERRHMVPENVYRGTGGKWRG